MLLMIDNYDSFTYNVVQYLGELGADVEVHRNDEITLAEIEAKEKIQKSMQGVVAKLQQGDMEEGLKALEKVLETAPLDGEHYKAILLETLILV